MADSDRFEALKAWIVANGGFIHKDLRYSPACSAAGSTLMSTAPIPAGAELLCCPHSCALSISAARKAFPQSFIDAVTPHGLLCFFLAQQRILGEKSFYAPYINVLPKEFTTPLYFDEKDMEFLQGTNLGEEDIEQRRRTWKKEWGAGVEALKQAGIESGEYTWELLLWSATVLTSRSFLGSLLHPPGETSEDDDHPILFPLVDALNHRPITPITWVPTSTSLTLCPNAALPPHQEVFNNYGPKANAELLMGYGFALADNPCEHVPLSFNPPLTSEQASIRALQDLPEKEGLFHLTLEKPNTSSSTSSADNNDNGEDESDNEWEDSPLPTAIIPPSLLQLFRLLTSTTFELPLLSANPKSSVSLRSELAALSNLLIALRMKLSRFPDTPPTPTNPRQEAASIYAKSQHDILLAAENTVLEKINETLGEHHGKRLVSLYSVLGDEKFKEAVEACFETNKKEELEEQGLEDVVFVLYLCWRYVRASRGKPVQNGDKEWIKRLEGVYGTPEDVENKMKANAGEDEDEEDEDVGGVGEIYDAVFPAAAEEAEDVFGGKEWTKGLLAWGMRVYREEGVGIVGVRVEPEEEGGWVEEEPEEEESVYVVEIRG